MLLFLVFFFVCNAPRPERCSLEGDIVRTGVALPFNGRFQRGLQRFFRRDSSFRCTAEFSFALLVGATICEKLRSKIENNKKSAEKFVRTTSNRQRKDFNNIPPL